MSWSRRTLLTLAPLGTFGCVSLSRTSTPNSWVEVCFGRHAMMVPPSLVASQRTQFELGRWRGTEHSEPAEIQALLARLQDSHQRTLQVYEPGEVSLETFEYGDARIELLVHENSPGFKPHADSIVRIDGGVRPLIIEAWMSRTDLVEAKTRIRKFLDSLDPLPTTEHESPFCSPSYSIDIPPDLGQSIEVSMGASDGRALVVESAYVRGREHWDMGAPALARDSLGFARFERAGTGVGNVHVRRRSLKVAGIRAPEVVWTTNEGRGGLLHFAWIHLGVAHDARRPFLSIYFSGDLASSSRRELGEQWKLLLGSLRPLPQRSFKPVD